MTDNRTTELLHKLLDERGVEYFTDDDERAYDEPARTTWDFVLCGLEMTVTATEFVDVEGKTYLEMDFHHAFTPEQAIAATLGSENTGIYDALDLLDEIHYADRISYDDYSQLFDAIAATLGSEFNPDGLPVGLTISDDGNLLDWRGENYVKQSTLCGGKLTAEQVRKAIRKYAQDDSCYIFEVYGEMCGPIADELNAELESEVRDD